MATIKIKFRKSSAKGKPGTIYYQIIHNRVVRQLGTSIQIYEAEWDKSTNRILVPNRCKVNDNDRYLYLKKASEQIRIEIRRFNRIIVSLEISRRKYTANDIISRFNNDAPETYMFSFMNEIIANLKKLGKSRTSETYSTTLSSFKNFREGIDLTLEDIDSDMMVNYESYLRTKGISSNTSSFYMRILRAVYNRAVDKRLVVQIYPFKHVYTGVDKTVKRAVPLKTMKKIKEMDLSGKPVLEYARDMFLFSFYTRGMSFVDMAYLQKKDLISGTLSYTRRKTGQQLFVKWEKCMQEIVEKYQNIHSPYLLPIINPRTMTEERKQYINSSHNINRSLKRIGDEIGLATPLTMYVSRHSWASIAKSKNVPISVISEGMGHESETTTRIYLASLDTAAIDKANNMILKSL